MKSNTYLKTVFIFTAAIYLVAFSLYGSWKHRVVDGGDSWGYYSYLPALFIQKDLKTLDKTLAVRKELRPNSVREIDGKLRAGEAPAFGDVNVIKYTCGIAILNIPAFAIGHLVASISDQYDSNGFSQPYIFFLYLNGLIAIFLGLFFIARFLSRHFDEKTVALTILCLALGTNLYYFGTDNNVMAHPYLFALWGFLIDQTDRFYLNPKLKHALGVGLSAGLIALIRPTELICFIFPLLYGVYNKETFTERLHFWKSRLKLGGIIVLTYGICAIPQFAYWKYVTGKWLYYSYTDEGFDFSDPEIYHGFFSFNNGWLVYAPIMILSLLGIILIRKYWKGVTIPFLLVFVIHIWITYSWWNWSYLNGFGSRPMVDIYALMAIPFAASVAWILKRNVRFVLFGIAPLLFILNFFQTYQNSKAILRTELANKGMYLQSLGKTKFDRQISIAFDLNQFQQKSYAVKEVLLTEDFETKPFKNRTKDRQKNGSYIYKIAKDVEQDVGWWVFPYEQINPAGEVNQLKISCWMFVEHQMSDIWSYASFFIDHRRNGEVYKRQYLRLHNKPGDPGELSLWWGIPHRWLHLEAYVKLKKEFKPGDEIHIRLNLPDNATPLFLDDIEFATALPN